MNPLIQYNKLMVHDLILRKRKRDGAGNFETDSETTLKGFLQFDSKLILTKNSEDLQAAAICFLKHDCGIDVTHEYWEIDQTAPDTIEGLEVLKIDRVDNPLNNTTHHYELWVR